MIKAKSILRLILEILCFIALIFFIGNYAVLKYKLKVCEIINKKNNHYLSYTSAIMNGVYEGHDLNFRLHKALSDEYEKNGFISPTATNVEWLQRYVIPPGSAKTDTQ